MNKKSQVLSFFLLFFLNVCAIGLEGAYDLQEKVKQIYKDKRNAIVRVFGIQQPDDPELKPLLHIGTGFFISREGHIMTNAFLTHCVKNLFVEMEGRSYEAETVGYDSLTNISVIKLKTLPENFSYLALDEASHLPEPGTFVVALSCKWGMDTEPSVGLLTGTNINFFKQPLPTTCLRSDMPCCGGEMGAPVFDLNGRLVGVKMFSLFTNLSNVIGAPVEEIVGSLILPVKAAMRVRDDLIFSGKMNYSYIGIVLNLEMDVNETIFGKGRMVVENVQKGSPGSYAGLKPGDEIIEFNQQQMESFSHFCDAMFFAHPGQYVNVKVRRNGKELSLTIKVEESTSPVFAQRTPEEYIPEEAVAQTAEVTVLPEADTVASKL